MIAQAKDPTLAMRCPSPLVLFGIDNRGKPKGARFGKEHASLAMKAATQLQLKVLASNDPKVAEIAARLPVGRVHATGRTFVPFIRRDLYDKLVAAAANGNAHPASPPNGSSGASGSTPGGSAPHLPRNWQEIGIGDLVVANQDRWEGWYEAIVVEANRRHVHVTLARLPAGAPDCAASASAWVALSRKPNRPERKGNQRSPQARQNTINPSQQNSPPTANRCPKIGTRSISIISCWPKTTADGGRGGKPSRSRKPTTCSSSAGARNMPANVPPITRPRLDLALICPDAA